MDQLKRTLVMVAATLVVATMAACTTTSPHPSPSATSSPHPKPVPTTAVAVPPSGETVLGQLANQRGINSIGPVAVTFDRIAVYVTCIGSGDLTITIPGVGSFPNSCDPTGEAPGTANSFDVRYVKSITVTASGENSLLWGMTVTAPAS